MIDVPLEFFNPYERITLTEIKPSPEEIKAEEIEYTCETCKFYDECEEEWYEEQGGTCEYHEPAD